MRFLPCLLLALVLPWSAWPGHARAAEETIASNPAAELALRAIGLIGTPYAYGGSDPQLGMDCSGLVRYLFRETWGAELPRTSAEMSRLGQEVDKRELQPGDLVFYNTLRRAFSHVGIYLGDNRFIHAPASGGQVRIEDMDLNYWKRRFDGARRLTPLQ